jgi:hypothetical protein
LGINPGDHPCGCKYGFRPERFRLVSEVGHPPISIQQPQPCTS